MHNRATTRALYAEKGELTSLLEETPEADLLGRMGLSSRIKEIEKELGSISICEQNLTETIIYFGGSPVSGSAGIDAEFAADALKKYQKAISVVFASQNNEAPIGDVGAIPLRDKSRLQITGTARGSFGFTLSEKDDQCSLSESGLFEAVEHTNQLIASSISCTDEEIEQRLTEEPERIIIALKDFFKTLSQANASIGILSSKTRINASGDKISEANARTQTITVRETTENILGTFEGARKTSRDFNFKLDDGNVLSGKLGNGVEDSHISTMNTEFQDKRCIGKFSLREISRKGSNRVTKKWILEDIYLSD